MDKLSADAARPRSRIRVLRTDIDRLTWTEAVDRMARWAEQGESRAVCICNVHSVVTALWNRTLRGAVNAADMATPDGWPVAAVMRLKGAREQHRITGPDLMGLYLMNATHTGTPVYFYGGTPETLDKLSRKLASRYPGLVIAGMESPPFRPLTPAEDEAACVRINASGAGVVFVGLGCPKQEAWMVAHRDRVMAVTVGVGAAFDFYAGTVVRAPIAMQRLGLEWLHRLLSDPRRLWKRYFLTNSVFVVYLFGVIIRYVPARWIRGLRRTQ